MQINKIVKQTKVEQVNAIETDEEQIDKAETEKFTFPPKPVGERQERVEAGVGEGLIPPEAETPAEEREEREDEAQEGEEKRKKKRKRKCI